MALSPGEGRTLALPAMANEAATQPPTPPEAAVWLARDAVDSLPAGELERRLQRAGAEGRPLRVKLGIDPTAPDIHLGHTVVLTKLREFQQLGHTIVLIIGDYTARVGDPTGRSQTRPVLSGEEIDAHADTFAAQAGRVLDMDAVELRRNGEWLDMPAERLFGLARTATVAQILERDDFAGRYRAREPISVLELLYPLLQGYDSVAVDADVELGGTDQKFNLLLGREVQRAYGVAEQTILTLPILTGVDGERKMSKSLGNDVGVSEPPGEMYGRTLRIPDTVLAEWWSLLLGEPPPARLAPRDAKRELARRLVDRYHGSGTGERAERTFDEVFLHGGRPEEIEESAFSATDGVVHLPALLATLFGISRAEARRLLEQGGVRLDGTPLGGAELDLAAAQLDGSVLQVGKRRYRRLRRT